MRRRLVILGLCLLAGAAINVLVAWLFAYWGSWAVTFTRRPSRSILQSLGLKPAEQPFMSDWGLAVPSRWPQPGHDLYVQISKHFGCEVVSATQLRVRRNDPTGFQMIVRCRTGWPTKGMQWGLYIDGEMPGFAPALGLDAGFAIPSAFSRTANGVPRRLPIRPLWPQFAINQVFYAVLIGIPFLLAPWWSARLRLKQNQCTQCGYSVVDLAICPECGFETSPTTPKDAVK